MPFAKGNKLGRANKGRKHEPPKTIWLLQSLAEHGVNLQDLLAKSLVKASKGDKQALELSHLLAKFLPHVANAPKQDVGISQVDTLVIARCDIPIQLDTQRTETPLLGPISKPVMPDILPVNEPLKSSLKAS